MLHRYIVHINTILTVSVTTRHQARYAASFHLVTALLQRSAHRQTNFRGDAITFSPLKVMVSVQLLSVVALIISLASDASTVHLPFNPREYPKKVVSCPAIDRSENRETRVDIELRMSRLFVIGSLDGRNPDSKYSQTTSKSTPRPKKRCYSCMGGPVYGRAGNIRYRNFRL